jgi:hypothetical protein
VRFDAQQGGYDMPMSTSQTPYGKESTVASKSTSDKGSEPKTETATAARSEKRSGALAPAGQSGDPTVQKLLAERELHRMHLEPAADPEAHRAAAQKKIDDIDEQLADLGFTAK